MESKKTKKLIRKYAMLHLTQTLGKSTEELRQLPTFELFMMVYDNTRPTQLLPEDGGIYPSSIVYLGAFTLGWLTENLRLSDKAKTLETFSVSQTA